MLIKGFKQQLIIRSFYEFLRDALARAAPKTTLAHYKGTLVHFRFTYSYLKASTGFAEAARIACQLTVSAAIVNAINPASAKIHQSRLMW